MRDALKLTWTFVRKNPVFAIATLAAAITTIFVKPDRQYLDYIDFRTLTCLFCVLAVVCALKNVNFFYILARRIVTGFNTARKCVMALLVITFAGSMLIANDMALLTFLPLGYFILSTTGMTKYAALTFILQNIAANLGGMLTPFGNPQNLYIYSHYNISNREFVQIMWAPFVLSMVMLGICCFFIKNEPLTLPPAEPQVVRKRTIVYLVLMVLAIAIVFRFVPYMVGLILIPIVIYMLDKKALGMVDYPLLLTFVAFFIFAGNMSRIGVVRELMSGLMEQNTLLYSTISCQFISNVPSAILLSQFTDNYRELLWGVNIGGVGTLISSLASLITFRHYGHHFPATRGRYVLLFLLINFIFLGILLAFCMCL